MRPAIHGLVDANRQAVAQFRFEHRSEVGLSALESYIPRSKGHDSGHRRIRLETRRSHEEAAAGATRRQPSSYEIPIDHGYCIAVESEHLFRSPDAGQPSTGRNLTTENPCLEVSDELTPERQAGIPVQDDSVEHHDREDARPDQSGVIDSRM
jgi:hypothetical protein